MVPGVPICSLSDNRGRSEGKAIKTLALGLNVRALPPLSLRGSSTAVYRDNPQNLGSARTRK